MSIYYKLINRTKKEYIDLGTIGYGLREHTYRYLAASLIGYLITIKDWMNHGNKQFDPDKDLDHDDESPYFFQGHWNGDNISLVDEHEEEYKLTFNPDNGWIDITKYLKDEWNKNIDYWYKPNPDDKDEESKLYEKLYFD